MKTFYTFDAIILFVFMFYTDKNIGLMISEKNDFIQIYHSREKEKYKILLNPFEYKHAHKNETNSSIYQLKGNIIKKLVFQTIPEEP